MAEYLIQEQSLTAIADAIRTKTGKNDLLTLENMPSEIANIEAGIDTSDATATSSHILNGKTAYVNGEKITGNIATKTSSDLTVSGATVTVPIGYYSSQASKSVATATQATPSISVDSAGKITASATQTAGYVTAGTKSATKQLTVQAAQTITPGTSNKTIASGRYLTGTQTIAGDADLVSSNIKKGVNIFGVTGSYDAASAALNFEVVGGTSAPTNPKENTIWVNTSTAISKWIFSSTKPTSPTSGMVWISTSTASKIEFNALKTNNIQVYPLSVMQYVNGAWVDKIAQTYKNGTWIDWIDYIIKNGKIDATLTEYASTWCKTTLTEESDNTFSITISNSMGLYEGVSATLLCLDEYIGIDLSKYSELIIDVKSITLGVNTANTGFWVGIVSGTQAPTSMPSTWAASAKLASASQTVIPLSGLTSGNYVICIKGACQTTSANIIKIQNMYLK